MKYKWIELINYAGIYNGMQLNQIKIDFSKCKTNKILIRGMNGSGKSTLMGSINVNPDSNDKFIPNAEARKNLCIIDNNTEYLIRYIHPVTASGRGTTKGYISKNINGQMVELNPNGNISSCRDILYEEFNLDSNFMALSQLSSEDRGLVDRKPAERKKLLNGIINALDTYNNIYKTLNKKSSIFRSTTNSLTYKIDSIGDETALQLNLKSVENRIVSLETQRDSLIESIASIKVKIDSYLDILRMNNYDTVISELSIIDTDLKSLNTLITKAMNNYNISNIDKINDFLRHLENKCIKLESSIDNSKKQLPLLLAEREAECKELEEKVSKLNALQSDYNYLDIKNAKLKAEQDMIKYEEVFNQMGLKNIDIITKSEFDSAMESLDYLKKCATALTANYDIDTVRRVYDYINDIEMDIANLPNLKNKLSLYRETLSLKERELYEFESMRKIAKELSNRPSNCSINDCYYIKAAVEANNKYPEDVYINLVNEVDSIKESITKTSNLIESTELNAEILKQINLIERELASKMRFINKLPVRPDFKSSFLLRVLDNDPFYDIDKLYNFIDCGNMIEEYKVAKQNLHNYEVEYKIYESKNEIIESILLSIEDLNKKTDKLAKDIENINADIKLSENALDETKKAKDKIQLLYDRINNEYIPTLEKQKELSNIKNSLEENNLQINNLQIELNKLNGSLGSVNSEIKRETEDRDKLKHASQLLVEYKTELDMYMKKYTKIEKIKYYASPNTGIQTIFMELYMNKIIAIANDLLSLLFEGEFTLKPFIINENEFRIPCMGNGLMHDDISSMSTAQKCMISMILSFSLLYQSSTKYNIIKLDELDAFLDTNNRGYFITLLDKLMSLLQCEQCFIVSHNNELASYNCDMVLLKNDNYICNGNENIIWQY